MNKKIIKFFKIFQSNSYIKRPKSLPKKRLNFNLKTILLVTIFLTTLIFFATGAYYFRIKYSQINNKISQTKEIVDYFKSQKLNFLNLKNNLISDYKPFEENLKIILAKINYNNVKINEISNNNVKKIVSFNLNNINNSQLAKLIYNLENNTPTIFIENMKVEPMLKSKDKFRINVTVLRLN